MEVGRRKREGMEGIGGCCLQLLRGIIGPATTTTTTTTTDDDDDDDDDNVIIIIILVTS